MNLTVLVRSVDKGVGVIVHVVSRHGVLAPRGRGAVACALSMVPPSRLPAPHGGMTLLMISCLGDPSGILARVAMLVSFRAASGGRVALLHLSPSLKIILHRGRGARRGNLRISIVIVGKNLERKKKYNSILSTYPTWKDPLP